MDNILTIIGEENQSIPLIFDSPHSGNIYPKNFNHKTTFEKLRQAEDSYVDELYEDVVEKGLSEKRIVLVHILKILVVLHKLYQ